MIVMGSPGSILRAPGSVTSLTQRPSEGQVYRDRRKVWLGLWPESEEYHGSGEERRFLSVYTPTSQTHARCVFCPGPEMELSLSLKYSPVGETELDSISSWIQPRGQRATKWGLSLPREIKGNITCMLLLFYTQAHHVCLPSTSRNFPILSSPIVLTLI